MSVSNISTEHFFGVSVAFDQDIDLSALKKTAGVKNAWSVTVMPRPVPYQQLTGSPASKDGQDSLPNYRGSERVNEPLTMAGVDKLHKQGIRGKGVQIAIIDTGVDYNHPWLGGEFGPGHNIALGHDLWETTLPASTPLCRILIHWPHVMAGDMGLTRLVSMNLTRSLAG